MKQLSSGPCLCGYEANASQLEAGAPRMRSAYGYESNASERGGKEVSEENLGFPLFVIKNIIFERSEKK